MLEKALYAPGKIMYNRNVEEKYTMRSSAQEGW